MISAFQNLFLSARQFQNDLQHATAIPVSTQTVRISLCEQNMRVERPQIIVILTVRQCKTKLDFNHENPICTSLIALFKCELLHDIAHRWSSEGTETPKNPVCSMQYNPNNHVQMWVSMTKVQSGFMMVRHQYDPFVSSSDIHVLFTGTAFHCLITYWGSNGISKLIS